MSTHSHAMLALGKPRLCVKFHCATIPQLIAPLMVKQDLPKGSPSCALWLFWNVVCASVSVSELPSDTTAGGTASIARAPPGPREERLHAMVSVLAHNTRDSMPTPAAAMHPFIRSFDIKVL